MKKCKFCTGKEDISNKVYDDGSTYSDCMMRVNIEYDEIFQGYMLKVSPVVYENGKKKHDGQHCFYIEYCPKCGRKLEKRCKNED